ncbi:MAG: chorismate synthase [Zetaproteobacteria bacterium]|nr:chorismate synthase [Zetaproteobacteria bacterium]
MSSTLGASFRVTTYGESHGGAVGVICDGIPACVPVDLEQIQCQLSRRRPGQSRFTTPRQEQDLLQVSSGLEDGHTLGTPVHLWVANKDSNPKEYESMKALYRPSHADFTTLHKYRTRPKSGGGRASARETVARVAAGAFAEQILRHFIPDLSIVAFVDQLGSVAMSADFDCHTLSREQVDQNPLRYPDLNHYESAAGLLSRVKDAGDSLGGAICCIIQGIPVGLGEPVFSKLEADLARAMLSIPACRGFEIGSGFSSITMLGSQHNDLFEQKTGGRIGTRTNYSGGVQGGISNGEPIKFRTAFKPVSTIGLPQQTLNTAAERVEYSPQNGRHDPCVVPRAVPIVESMAAVVLLDHFLRHRGQNSLDPMGGSQV